MSAPASKRWIVRDKRSELTRRPWLEVFRESIELPTGRVIDDFYSVSMQDFGVAIALTDNSDVVVEKLYRHGPQQMTWSLPAGYVHSGESALEATQRELLEETGYETDEWVAMGRFIVDGNRGCGWGHCFLARRARFAQEPRSDDLAEVETSLVPWNRLLELLAAGEITELASAAAIGLACIHFGSAGSP